MKPGACGKLAAFVLLLGLAGCRHFGPASGEGFPSDVEVLHVTFEWLAFQPEGRPAPKREIWLMRETPGKFELERVDGGEVKKEGTEPPLGLQLVARSKPFLMPADGKGYLLKLVTKPTSGPVEVCLYVLEDLFKYERVVQFQQTRQFRDIVKPLHMKVCDAAGTPAGGVKGRLVYHSPVSGDMTLWQGKTDSSGEVPFLFNTWFNFMPYPMGDWQSVNRKKYEYMNRFSCDFSDPELGNMTRVLGKDSASGNASVDRPTIYIRSITRFRSDPTTRHGRTSLKGRSRRCAAANSFRWPAPVFIRGLRVILSAF